MKIIKANKSRIKEWVDMRLALWPKHTRPELTREAKHILVSRRESAFLVVDGSGSAVGFAEVSTRDYVDGCKGGPVGFLEGIYVRPGHRKKGIALRLVRAGELWAAARGCREMGSDTQINGRRSIAFHKAVGFRVVERQVVFMKKIKRQ
ncbi:MAG: aminoglycoside 6'-N-acetyltransferase [Elusimicrobiota bacterium]